MRIIDKNRPVLVTGASGYVAGWLVKRLLDEGLTVHAAVRDPKQTDKVQHLRDLAEKSRGQLHFFAADLLVDGAYDQAMAGCELVYHTASPFTLKVQDTVRDLIDPALKGTRNVLESVNRSESVKRVVLTSSVAAVFGDAVDLLEYPNQTASEEQWNTSSSPTHQAYSYSKTVAEREAWRIAGEQNRWDLVVINPSLVIGPGLNPRATSESFNLVRQLGDGQMKSGAPDFRVGVVDVRDVAEAHFRVGFTPEAAGRHIISAAASSFMDLADILRRRFGDAYPFPKRIVPKWLVWLMAPLVGFQRRMISRNVGYPWKIDNRKGIEKLGMNYRPVEESITELFQQMIDNGYFYR
jgi:dihydroflavonol-4-reductase